MQLPTWSEGSALIVAVAELLRALQWPIVVLIIARFFRGDIQKLLTRVRRGSLFGAEVELEQALDLLEEGTSAAGDDDAMDIPMIPAGELPPDRQDEEVIDLARLRMTVAKERDILRTAAVSPRAALMLLSSEIEATLRHLAEDDDVEDRMPGDARFMPVSQITRGLTTAGAIDERTEDNIENLWKARALVLHEGQGEDDDVLRAVDSGLMILRALSSIDPSLAAPASEAGTRETPP